MKKVRLNSLFCSQYPYYITKLWDSNNCIGLDFGLDFTVTDDGTDHDQIPVTHSEDFVVRVVIEGQREKYFINTPYTVYGAAIGIFGKLLSVLPHLVMMYRFYWMGADLSNIIEEVKGVIDKILGPGAAEQFKQAFKELERGQTV